MTLAKYLSTRNKKKMCMKVNRIKEAELIRRNFVNNDEKPYF